MSYIEQLFSLRGRTAVVTGGYGHLGTSMCRVLAAAGARVYCAGPSKKNFYQTFYPDKNFTANPDSKNDITANAEILDSDNINYLPFDLASAASHKKALEQVWAGAGALDILVNNAFFLSPEPACFRRDMDGLLHKTVALSEQALDLLRHSDQGRIVNIASMYGMVAPDPRLYSKNPQQRSRASYNAAKAALLQLTRYWSSFWGSAQFTVNAITPGPFPRAGDAEFCRQLSERTIAGRLGQPQDLHGALLLLCSQAGAYITGQNLVVDGGWTTR